MGDQQAETPKKPAADENALAPPAVADSHTPGPSLADAPVALAWVIGPTPFWAMIVGSVFGAVTLLGLFFFAYLAGSSPKFVCNTFVLLAAIFSLGCALSAGFIGGAAAANGQLGAAASNNVLNYSLGGGVSVLVIVFLIFQILTPSDCTSKGSISTLEFDNLPSNINQIVDPGFWYRIESSLSTPTLVLRIRMDEDAQTGPVELTILDEKRNTKISCVINVHNLDDFDSVKLQYSEYEFKDIKLLAGETGFHLSFEPPPQQENSIKAKSRECLFNKGKLIQDFVAISRNNRKVMFGVPKPIILLNDVAEPAARSSVELVTTRFVAGGANLITGQALAEEGSLAFLDLKKRLSSSSDVVRVQARRYLEANFAKYKDDVLPEIFSQNPDDGGYLASLLSGLISGIDGAANPIGSLFPGQKREFSTLLPYVVGHENEIVNMNGHPSDAVKQQARRLVSRFPFDGFSANYMNIMENAAKGHCSVEGVNGVTDGIIYSGIFFFYNRLIQKNYNEPALSEEDIKEADRIGLMVHDAATHCLPLELATDAALIDFGRAIIYSEDKSGKHSTNAKAAADEFLISIKDNEKLYFLRSHIATMKKLAS